ncbi:MAG: putative Phosphatidylinositol alpha-mannosyltransferase [Nitrospira sp.]|nr:putative Phosphatidylinositol alpha-mannosyltransferase [Nitrospira sp.]
MAVGGQELAVLLHAERLLKRGHQARLVLEPQSPIMAMARDRGLPVEPFVMQQWRLPLSILAFRRLLKRERPDIVHVNSSRDSWIAGLSVRLVKQRPKLIRTRHISAPLTNNRATHLLYRRLFDMVIVTGGERNRRDLIQRDGLAPDRVAAFPIGLDVEYFSPAKPRQDIRSELGIPAGHRLVGLISYLRDYKGHRYFVEAAAKVLKQHQGAAFLIVGEGPEEQNIRVQIERLGLTGDVRMLGFREDLLDVFRSLDLFVIPTIEGDTIPQVLMQALAIGLPVVSTTTGSIPDVVADGESGFIVPPRDADALADRIGRLLADSDLRASMGRRGRQTVERCYSIDRMVDELERVYQRVVSS